MTPPVCTRCGASLDNNRTQFCVVCGAPEGLAPHWSTTRGGLGPGSDPGDSTEIEPWRRSAEEPVHEVVPPPSPAASVSPASVSSASSDGSPSAWRRFRNRSTVLAIVVLLVDGAVYFLLRYLDMSSQLVNHIGEYAFIYLAVLWLGIVVLSYTQFLGDSAQAGYRALTPVPTPQEIAAQLHGELGRPPTLVEVAAVQQMLATARNQDVLTASIGVASWLAVREALEKKE